MTLSQDRHAQRLCLGALRSRILPTDHVTRLLGNAARDLRTPALSSAPLLHRASCRTRPEAAGQNERKSFKRLFAHFDDLFNEHKPFIFQAREHSLIRLVSQEGVNALSDHKPDARNRREFFHARLRKRLERRIRMYDQLCRGLAHMANAQTEQYARDANASSILRAQP